MHGQLTALKKYLGSYFHIPEELLGAVADILIESILPKGEHFVRADQY